MTIELDVVIPVYNEGAQIRRVLDTLDRDMKTKIRVLICYDHDDDDTLVALEDYRPSFPVVFGCLSSIDCTSSS